LKINKTKKKCFSLLKTLNVGINSGQQRRCGIDYDVTALYGNKYSEYTEMMICKKQVIFFGKQPNMTVKHLSTFDICLFSPGKWNPIELDFLRTYYCFFILLFCATGAILRRVQRSRDKGHETMLWDRCLETKIMRQTSQDKGHKTKAIRGTRSK